jgi:hypothetical protein
MDAVRGPALPAFAWCAGCGQTKGNNILSQGRFISAIVTLKDVRRFALSLPEVTEQPHFEMSSFRVRGRIFVTIPTDVKHIHVFVDEHETRASVAEDSSTFEELWWGKKLAGLRVNLRQADRQRVFELIEEAWRRKAPKKLASLRMP